MEDMDKSMQKQEAWIFDYRGLVVNRMNTPGLSVVRILRSWAYYYIWRWANDLSLSLWSVWDRMKVRQYYHFFSKGFSPISTGRRPETAPVTMRDDELWIDKCTGFHGCHWHDKNSTRRVNNCPMFHPCPWKESGDLEIRISSRETWVPEIAH